MRVRHTGPDAGRGRRGPSGGTLSAGWGLRPCGSGGPGADLGGRTTQTAQSAGAGAREGEAQPGSDCGGQREGAWGNQRAHPLPGGRPALPFEAAPTFTGPRPAAPPPCRGLALDCARCEGHSAQLHGPCPAGMPRPLWHRAPWNHGHRTQACPSPDSIPRSRKGEMGMASLPCPCSRGPAADGGE